MPDSYQTHLTSEISVNLAKSNSSKRKPCLTYSKVTSSYSVELILPGLGGVAQWVRTRTTQQGGRSDPQSSSECLTKWNNE